ncbi:putative PEP-CTERM system TPR-repeat lipoprotein (plasmid) [Acinetobacter lwoffii]|uniref:CFI-box-CTERM domain-containing protein n=6 Tax=Gammaproteobacteria TaxID=1236 RepID=UPI000EB76EC5|nr:CFI-box-CTERM domain-containing protein [Acinetobacter lwoffii]AXX83715.1 putative PEP-CTERM system TPR-repeat lipoprotein [Acinetobacter lwoffii]
MDHKKLVGNLFGVDIHLPLKRNEVRDLVRARQVFIEDLIQQKNLNERQASLDASDLLIEFCTQLNEEEAKNLSELLKEEAQALLPKIEDTLQDIESSSKTQLEADLSHIEAQAIFNELSANLQVYGTNSKLSGANPANIDLALAHINRSLELQPDNPIFLNLKGLLLWQGKNDRVGALPLIQRAAKLDPKNINIQHNLKAIEDPKGCFIATASFGTPVAYEINELRYWRDTKLSGSRFGRLFINTYYTLSPPIAKLIAKNAFMKKVIRSLLRPLISYVKKTNQNDSR